MKTKISSIAYILAGILFLSGCTAGARQPEPQSVPEPKPASGIVLYGPGDYDSVDTPILIEKDEKNKALTFLNTTVSKQYTLTYDGITRFASQRGDAVTLDSLEVGDLVDLKFVKSKKYLTSMSAGADVWRIDDTDQYIFDYEHKNITIGTDVYKISSDAVFLADGKFITYQDLNSMDTLSFQGIGNTVYSIRLSKGHGYLRLTGHEYFVGGLIEVGSKLVSEVTEDMLITMPEGTYSVMISNAGTIVDFSVLIRRGEETKLDLGGVEIENPKTGMVLFSLSPSDAELYIDGEPVDAGSAITLKYGMHQLICRAKGYQSVTKYFTVGQESAGLNITLEAAENGEDEPSEDRTEKDAAAENDATSTSYYKVHIDSPEGVEVYLDGSYVGVAPCTFRKTAGTHILTLSRTGYVTRSYTIVVDSEDKDVSFSFVDLIAERSVSE